MDNLNNKLSNEEQSQPSCLGSVTCGFGSHRYKAGKSYILQNGMGYFSDKLNDGVYMEYDGNESSIVIIKEGKQYKQTYSEFISNCK